MTTTQLKQGMQVTYNSGYKDPEKGIVKRHDEGEDHAFVVYNCGGDWENYREYTGASTPVSKLTIVGDL